MFSAELRRQLTGVTFIVLLICAVGFAVVSALGVFWGGGFYNADFDSLSAAQVTQKMAVLSYGAFFPTFIYGALSATRDFDTNFVARQSFLAGGISRLMLIKILLNMLAGVIFSVLAVAGSLIVAAITLATTNKGLDLRWDTLGDIFSVVVVIIGYGMFGFLIGWIIRRALVATLSLVVYIFFIDQWSLGSARQNIINDDMSMFTSTLPLGAAYLIFFSWILLVGVVAYVLSSRRDVTI